MDHSDRPAYSRYEWLNRRGGRVEADVKKGTKGEYVEMFNPECDDRVEFVYLPKSFEMK